MINKIIDEMKTLRGATVQVFGQPTILSDTVEDLEIDVINVLEGLKPYAIDSIDIWEECSECNGMGEVIDEDSNNYIDCENCLAEGGESEEVEALKAIDILEDIADIKEIRHDNSYNWGSKLNHDIDFIIYESLTSDLIYVVLKVHRFGDVRGNYTNDCVLEFDTELQFLEMLQECSTVNGDLEIEGHIISYTINATSDTVDCYCDDMDIDNNFYDNNFYVNDLEELKQEIKEYYF